MVKTFTELVGKKKQKSKFEKLIEKSKDSRQSTLKTPTKAAKKRSRRSRGGGRSTIETPTEAAKIVGKPLPKAPVIKPTARTLSESISQGDSREKLFGREVLERERSVRGSLNLDETPTFRSTETRTFTQKAGNLFGVATSRVGQAKTGLGISALRGDITPIRTPVTKSFLSGAGGILFTETPAKSFLTGIQSSDIILPRETLSKTRTGKAAGALFNVSAPNISKLFSLGREEKEQSFKETAAFSTRVVGELTPRTTGGFLAVGAAPFGLSALGAGAVGVSTRAALGVGFAGLGAITALDSTRSPEQRVAGGIIGGLGALGAVSEVSPFVAGGFAKFSRDFTPIKPQTIKGPGGREFSGIDVIGGVPTSKGLTDIALIPPGQPKAGSSPFDPAFIRGAFQTPKSVQQSIVGKQVDIASTQASQIVGRSGKTTPLDRIFFGTAQDPLTGVAQTRVSRAGFGSFQDPFGGFSLKLLPQRPQIVLFKGQTIGAPGKTVSTSFGEQVGLGASKGFVVGPKGSIGSELEVGTLSTITSGGKVGVTTLGGRKVKIFEADLGLPKETSSSGFESIKGLDVSSFVSPGRTSLGQVSSSVFGTGVIRGSQSLFGKSSISQTSVVPSSFIFTPSIDPLVSPPSSGGGRSRGGGGSTSGGSIPPTTPFFSPPPRTPRRRVPPTRGAPSGSSLPSRSVDPFKGLGGARQVPFPGLGLPKNTFSIIKKGRIAPSLTGLALFDFGGITGGPLPSVGSLTDFGILPGTIRKVPKKKKGKSKTKKKSKKKKKK